MPVHSEAPRVWRALCLAHDPALVVDAGRAGYPTAEAGADEMEAQRDRMHSQHRGCDMLLGLFREIPHATPELLEVACPPHPFVQHLAPHQHEGVERLDVAWLRLLAVTYRLAGDPSQPGYGVTSHGAAADAIAALPPCWTYSRVRRLEHLLPAVPRG